ncbi:LamG-like jellyroll fold domain-containing protein [Candidatus Parabeggiatoa sp. HSG14]|uniref:LamG-like jellyroll fold domain-containing protein n=1 Tax=Candidatus Parabeggiatoa sp. HSG14 TaxID=3055593 RepID=UPI0025A69462|nr:Calx-beta domain-containing protein [Thiotrichales bacterium HSG14]
MITLINRIFIGAISILRKWVSPIAILTLSTLLAPMTYAADMGKALELNGTNYVQIDNEENFDITGDLTVEAWIKVNQFNRKWQAIVTKGNDSWRLSRNGTTNTIAFDANGNPGNAIEVRGSINVNDGKWHHIAGVHSANYLRLYVDGILDKEVNASFTYRNSYHPVMIGENAQETGRLFEGQIDEVRIWNTARSEAEIQANMNITLQGNESGLVAYYPFEAILTSDQTNNTNDGTLINSSNLVNSRVDPIDISIDSVFKTALSFDGIDDYVSIPNNANLQFGTAIDFSVEFWVKTTTNYNTPILSNKDWSDTSNKGFIFAQTGSTWVFEISDGRNFNNKLAGLGVINDGFWHHLAVTVDRDGDIIAYQDGILKASTRGANIDGGIDDINSGFGLKIAQDGTGDYLGTKFIGQIDEVRIWNTIRTQTEIQANLNTTLQGDESGLVAYYPLDEGTGTHTTDQTNNTNDGTLINGPTWINSDIVPIVPVDPVDPIAPPIDPDDPKIALDFDGISSYVSIPENANLRFGTSTDFTVEFWVKTTENRNDPALLSDKDWGSGRNKGFAIAQTGQKWKFNLGDGTNRIDLEDIGVINDGLWHHLAVTVAREGDVIAYHDGVVKTSAGAEDIGDVNSGLGLKIAQDGIGEYEYQFLGQIDEVRVWNIARTQDQIQASMNTTLQGNEARLVAYYPLDKGTGTHITDQTNHNNDGTFINSPTWVNNGAVEPVESIAPIVPVEPNTPPTITGTPPTTAKVGWIYSFTPTASDSDGDTLTFSLTNKPDWAKFYPSTGTLSGIPTDEDTNNNIEISVSDGATTATLATFDLTIKKVTLFNASTVHIEEGPKAITINPQNNQIYLVNEKSDSVTATDSSGNLENTIAISVGVTPTALAINLQTNQVYVVNERSNNMMVIDGDTNIVLGTIKVGTQPTAIAVNSQTNQVYVANYESSNVTVIDGNANTAIGTIEVGTHPTALAINPQTNQIYVANQSSNNVTVIDGNTNTTIGTVEVGTHPIALAINPLTHQIYVANYESHNVTVIDGDNNTTTIEAGNKPTAIAINLVTNQIYVVNQSSHNVTMIDSDNHTTTIDVGHWPTAITINPQTHQIYVTNNDSDNVTVIDGFNNTTTIDVGSGSRALAINPQTHQIYVTNYASDNVTVITPSEKTYLNPLAVEISPIPNNETSLLTPLIVSFKATDAITQIYYQITGEDENKGWIKATLTDNKNSEVKITQLPRGDYIIRAVATDAIMETSLNNATGTNSPFIGEISTDFFKVVPSPIILDNSGEPHLTEINEDIDSTDNIGTKISDMLATGANNAPIADGDYDAVKGIAVIAMDNTNGTWEYSLDNGESWIAFGIPSETDARLLLIDGHNTRIRFQPNMNFEGTVKQGLTFRAWEQQTGGGDNGGTVDMTDTELDPYALSTETETANITVTDIPEKFTGLYLETSAATILNKDKLDIVGKLSVFPETGENLSDYEIVLTITAPDGITQKTQTTTTHTDTGQFNFQDLSLLDLFAGEMQEGAFGFQAKFVATAELAVSESTAKAVLVGASAGYAILVQGKIQNEEGLAAHKKTSNRIYKTLKERGFDNDNLHYFNYSDTTDKIIVNGKSTEVIVRGKPTKTAIAQAFTDLQGRMNSNPAPLYVIMINHGGIDGTFHIYDANNSSNDNVILPSDVDNWLDTLETGLEPNAKKKARLVILGYCYSGSFISELTQKPTFTDPEEPKTLVDAGRIIITSATAQEESYKGPEEPDGVRSGEFFMEEFFTRLNGGDNIKQAFEFATEKTESFTRKGGDANTTNRFYDIATQHPLLDDNGDGQGSNTFTANGDGVLAQEILLGIGLNYDTNTAENPAEILSVSNTVYLSATESTATLEAKVNNANHINSAPVDIRKPSIVLNSSGTEASEQLEISNLPRRFMSCSGNTNVCMTHFDQFTEQGMYEAFYFVRDTETNNISPIKRSVIYKNYADNLPPSTFDLVEPLDGSEHKTTLLFKWDSSTDLDGSVTYNFIVAKDDSFSEIVYQQEELEIAMTYIDDAVGLADQTTYYWKIEAVDPFGAKTPSSSVFAFNTNNTNAPPGISSLHISSALDFQAIDGVEILLFDEDGNPLPNPEIYQDQGHYNILSLLGRRRAKIQVAGYEEQEIDLYTSQDTTQLNVEMIPVGGIPAQQGELQFTATTVSLEENTGTATILVERVKGSDTEVTVNYTTVDGSATAGSDYSSTSGTLTWMAKDERPKAINLSITDDQDYEENETFTIILSNPTGGAILGSLAQTTLSIAANDKIGEDSLHNLGRGMAVTKEGSMFTANALAETTGITVTFRGGASVNNQEYQANLTTTPSKMVKITGEIDVADAHIGQKADILVVIGVLDDVSGAISQFLMLDKKGQFQVWNGEFATLVSSEENVVLSKTQAVKIYQGFMPPVQFQIYFGYRLKENGSIYFNGEQAIEVQVKP